MDIGMLKEYLGDTLYAQAEEKLSAIEGLQVIAAHDGTWLPKARLDEEIAKRRELQGAREEMAGRVKDGEALEARVEELTRELEDSRKSARMREALAKAGARDAALVERLLKGADEPEEEIAELRRKSPYLFYEAAGSRAGFGGGRERETGAHADVNGAIRAAAGRY